MASVQTLLRDAEHAALSTLTLSGNVLDLGGNRDAQYLQFIAGEKKVTVVNLDEALTPDLSHDLELPLPLEDASFDHALLINVLEHVFEYRQLLREAARVVRPSGTVVVVVPFLFPIHPDPHDFWRFSGETLEREFAGAGLTNVQVTPLGSGVFAARYLLLDRLLPGPVRVLFHYTARPLAKALDALWSGLARLLGKKYEPSDYALGYLVTGSTRA